MDLLDHRLHQQDIDNTHARHKGVTYASVQGPLHSRVIFKAPSPTFTLTNGINIQS